MLEKVIGTIIDETYALAIIHTSYIISFYHLSTQGRAGIQLVDADTSPTYL